jgi:predicted transcriptional regulator
LQPLCHLADFKAAQSTYNYLISLEEVAEALTVNQPAVAKLEKRGDMHVSNLRRNIEALGGTLEITAHFADTTVVINNVGDLTTTP